MAIQADVFVATPADASDYARARLNGQFRLNERYQRVEFKGVTGLEFCTLWAVLEGEPRDVKRHALLSIALGNDGHSWLDRFPEPMVARLAGLDQPTIANASALWPETAKLQGAELSDVLPVLGDLKRLALAAQTTERGMYLWGSL